MQSVELLDDDARHDVRASDVPSPRASAAVRRGGRVLLPAAAAVVLALVGTQAVLLHRDAAAEARIQSLPGIVHGIDADVAALWRVDERDLEFVDRSVSVGGSVVGVRTALDGSQRVEAVDAANGRSQWSAPLRGPDPELALRGGVATRSACETVPSASDGDPVLVACLGSDAVVSIGDRNRTTYVRAPERSHVVVVDTADGRVVSDQPGTAAIDLTTLPGLVVLGAPGGDGHAEVTAQDLLTGGRVWSRTSPPPGIDPAGDVGGFRLFRLGDLVGVQEARRQVTLLSSAGEVVRERTAVLDGTPVVVGKDRLELLTGFGEGRPTTTIVRPGRPDAVVPGYLLQRSVDDGSLPGLELTYGSTMRAWDAAGGDPLWESDGPVGGPTIVLHGLVICLSGASEGEVLAFDGRTGALVWTANAGTLDQTPTLLTDGTSLIVANSPAIGETVGTFDAFALDTGERTWSTGTTDLLGPVTVRGDLLVSASDDEAVVLGSPDAG